MYLALLERGVKPYTFPGFNTNFFDRLYSITPGFKFTIGTKDYWLPVSRIVQEHRYGNLSCLLDCYSVSLQILVDFCFPHKANASLRSSEADAFERLYILLEAGRGAYGRDYQHQTLTEERNITKKRKPDIRIKKKKHTKKTCLYCDNDDHVDRIICCKSCQITAHPWCLDVPRSTGSKSWICTLCDTSLTDECCKDCGGKLVQGAAFCHRCGTQSSFDPLFHLWKTVSDTPDNYNTHEKTSDINKIRANRIFAKRVANLLPSKQGRIFVLDSGTTPTCNALIERGFTKDNIYCTNNTTSATSIRDANVCNIIPLSAQDYFDGFYSRWFPVPIFDAAYLDLCGTVKTLKKIHIKLKTRCVLVVTVCKRGEKDTLTKCDKAIRNILAQNGSSCFKLDIQLEYEGMITLFYEGKPDVVEISDPEEQSSIPETQPESPIQEEHDHIQKKHKKG